ncbi:alpha-ketoacid dehydrogenase kinase [Ramicandelaber brevisporus]|nr:alpha-ketoacid dehydrogenase kinase [Ramicandelaber brevisporus]
MQRQLLLTSRSRLPRPCLLAQRASSNLSSIPPFLGEVTSLPHISVETTSSTTAAARASHSASSSPALSSSRRSSNGNSKPGDFYDSNVAQFAKLPIRPVTLQQLMCYGHPPLTLEKIIASAEYSRSELPVRMAKLVIQSFQKLPFIVGTNPHINSVYKLYVAAFERLRDFPPIETLEQSDEFTKRLHEHIQSLTGIIPKIAQGFLECKRYLSARESQMFLDDVIHSRIGLRLIAEQHVALHNDYLAALKMKDSNSSSPSGDYIGIIDTKLSPANFTEKCARFVQTICEANYGIAPVFRISGHLDSTFQYIPVHLQYILEEALKNAYRATVEHSQKRGHTTLPPIEITVGCDHEEVGIRIRDMGGGVRARDLPHIFDYSFTTVKHAVSDSDSYSTSVGGGGGGGGIFLAQSQMDMQSGIGGPMAGLGFGLPMARVYCRYFGGDLKLVSMEGLGCDLFIKLPSLSRESEAIEI